MRDRLYGAETSRVAELVSGIRSLASLVTL